MRFLKLIFTVGLLCGLNEFAFAQAPTITGFSPMRGALGTTVTITGTNLSGATSVNIGGVAASNLKIISSTQITAVVGAKSNTAPVTVTTSAGSASTAGTSLGFWKDGRFTSHCNPKVHIHRSLAIRDSSVINDARAKGMGAWAFNSLMSSMAPTGMSPSLFIKKWVQNWANTRSVNGFAITTPNSANSILSNWPRTTGAAEADGTAPLDLNFSRFRLVAILFRPDLSNTAPNSAGEGRFVFTLGSSSDSVIFEYKLPISLGSDPMSAANWMNRILILSHNEFGASYNSALTTLTQKFTNKNYVGVPGMVNGSAINQVRTNTIGLEGAWRLREFRLTPVAIAGGTGIPAAVAGELVSSTTHANPNDSLGTLGSTLETWINQNSAGFLSASVPETPRTMWGGITTTGDWNFSSKVVPADVKRSFSMTTCRGCHSPNVNLANNTGASNPFLQASIGGFATFMSGTDAAKLPVSMVVDPIVWSSKPMPFGFTAPFKFNADRTFTANVGYSDLHFRSRILLNRFIGSFCN